MIEDYFAEIVDLLWQGPVDAVASCALPVSKDRLRLSNFAFLSK